MLSLAPALLFASLVVAAPAQQQAGLRHIKRADPEEVSRLFSRQNSKSPGLLFCIVVFYLDMSVHAHNT